MAGGRPMSEQSPRDSRIRWTLATRRGLRRAIRRMFRALSRHLRDVAAR
jgi:hypothetical protein